MTTLLQLIRWVLGRLLTGILIVALGLGSYATWLFLHDNADFDLRHRELLTTLAGKREEIRRALEDIGRRRDGTTAEIAAEGARAHQADKVIATLHDLESTWDRFIGNPAQQKANAEQIKRMEEVRDTAQAKQAGLQQEVTRLVWERDGRELELGKIDSQIAFAEKHNSAVWHYVTQAWEPARWLVMAGLVVYFFVLLMFAPRPRRD